MKLLTKTEISNKLGLGVTTLEKLIDDLKVTRYEIGKRAYFDYDSIIEGIQNQNQVNKTDKNKPHENNSKNLGEKLHDYKVIRNEINKKLNKFKEKVAKYDAQIKMYENELNQLTKSTDTYIRKRNADLKEIVDDLDGQMKFTKQAMLDFIYTYAGTNIPAYMKKILSGYDYEEGINTINTDKGLFDVVVENGVIISLSKQE